MSFAIDQAIAPTVIGQLEYEPWASRVSWHIRWPGNDGLAKVVETSTDLIRWGPLPANATVVEGDASLPLVDSESERFFRVRIRKPQ